MLAHAQVQVVKISEPRNPIGTEQVEGTRDLATLFCSKSLKRFYFHYLQIRLEVEIRFLSVVFGIFSVITSVCLDRVVSVSEAMMFKT